MSSLYARYIYAVRDANEVERPEEWNFKSDVRYGEVLEHTPVEFAVEMLKWSIKAMPGLDLELVRSLCDINDSFGKPKQAWIDPLGKYAPSNMRYLCHAIKVWQHIDTLGLSEVEIIEIGGGYGGLALWIDGLRGYFPATLLNYTVIDFPEVATLIDRMFRSLGLPWEFRAFGPEWVPAVSVLPAERFCVSNYAFSEFDQKTRDWYAERVLEHCQHGLMVWNFPEALKDANGQEFGGPPYQFVKWPLTCVPDEPRLYEGHEMVTW